MKKFLALFLTLTLALSMVACSQNKTQVGEEETAGTETTVSEEIHFSQSVDDLKQYDGKTVTIDGFMSMLTPLDNSLFYLMNASFQSCPFCVPNDVILTNTIAVECADVELTTMPIRITGTLVFGEFSDEYGYEYSYKIKDAKMVVLDTDDVSDSIGIYCDVARNGYVDELFMVMDWIYQVAYYKECEIDPNELAEWGLIDFCCYEEIKAYVEDLNTNGEYDNLIGLLDGTEEVSELINVELEKGNIEAYPNFQVDADELYEEFCNFVNQFEF